MSCNCKTDTKVKGLEPKKIEISGFLLKILGFMIICASLPVLNVIIIWYVFKGLVLGESIDLKPLITKIGEKFSNDEKIIVNKE